MANKAAANLAALNQDIDEIEDAATALARISPDNATQQAPGDTAEFGTPEAIATAVFATVLLGPIGGILVGGAQGLLKKQSDQKLLETLANEQSLLNTSLDIRSDQLTAFRDSAVNANDLEQIEVMQTKLDVANEYIKGGNPEQAAAIMQGLDTDMQTHARNQETDRVAFEAEVKADKRQLGLDTYARYDGMRNTYDAQSAGWIARQEAIKIGRGALMTNNPAMLNTAMVMINKAIDADSAVLQGEKDSTAAMGTLWDKAQNILNQVGDGAQLTASQRRQFGEAFDQIDDISTAIQLRIDQRAQKRAVEDLIPKYADRFNLVGEMAPREPLNIPNDAKDEIQNMPADIGEKIGRFLADQWDKEKALQTDNIQAITDFVRNTGGAIGDTAEEVLKRFQQTQVILGTRRPTN